MSPEKFKALRLLRGMSQDQFAKALGYNSVTMISRKEGGKARITRQDEIIIDFFTGRDPAQYLQEVLKK